MSLNPNGMFIEAHIADLHFGALDPKYQYKILKEQYISKLEAMPILDIVSVNGDIFHHKFMANSDAVSVACYFITDLIRVCEEKHATLMIIAGTYSHDADQIKLFYPLAERSSNTDIRIIENVKFEYVKGKKILCIPELYGKGKEFYNGFLRNSGLYDACYMHGTYVGAIFGKNSPDLDSQREPVFCMEDFQYCLGPIISGHVHQAACYDSHFYYCGSPYRWTFGDEGEKGFYILLQDITTHRYAVDFEPIISDKYITMNLDAMIHKDPKKIIDYIEDRVRNEQIKFIRLEITQNNPDTINALQTFYRNNKNVSILNKAKDETVVKSMEEAKEKYEEYNYIFDPNISPEVKLSRYINQCMNTVFITPKDLVDILNDL